MIPPVTRRSCCLIACAVFGFLLPAAATETNRAWSVRAWRSDDGLPNNYVTGLAQTPDGYLWVATYSRPARFDGVRFEEFSPRTGAGGAGDKVAALCLGRDGGLWVGLLHGAIVWLNARETHVFTNGLPDRVAQAMVEDGEGALWITYRGGSVYRLQDGVARPFTAQDGLPPLRPRDVCSIAKDAAGRLWFAKNGSVGIFQNGRFETRLQLPDVTTQLAAARSGGIWISSGFQLLNYREGETPANHGSFVTKRDDAEPTVMLEDRNGAVWIGTSDSGLFRYDDSGFRSVPTSDQSISSLLEDHEGNLWAGTGSGGLNRVRPRLVQLETAETGLPFETVQSLCEDAGGAIWATTLNGLLLRRGTNGWSTISAGADWPGGRASCVVADATGAVWIGTRDRALHRWRDGRFETWRRADGLAAREIHALWVDQTGGLWIGEESPDLVQRFRDGTFETFSLPPGIRIVRAMTGDAAGNIWAGTSKGMLLRIAADGTVHDETARTTGSPTSIRCLQATPDGGLWIGYADKGLGWLRGEHFARLGSREGLDDDTISQIIADDRGWLWFGSDRGIFKARQQDLEATALGRAGKLRCIHCGPSEGLFSLEANAGDSPGALRSRDHRLWIPMRTGLAIADPDRLPGNAERPAVLLKQLSVDDRVVAADGGVMPVDGVANLRGRAASLRLQPGHHRLEIEFTALSFAAPENVIFRYRLEGFDDDWVEAGTQRTAKYPRLPAGDYRFVVKACNSDGVWNETGAALAFTVAPFVWQTWWFRVAAVALLIGATGGIVRYVSFRRLRARLLKLEQQTALDRERARIARDIHDDLGGRLTEVELLLEMTHRAAADQREGTIRRISSAVREVGESLDEIVWAVNPRHDSLPHLVNYLGQYAIEFLQAAGVRCRVDLPHDPPKQSVPPEVRHNLYLAVKEALNNLARHAQATEAWLRASLDGDSLRLTIEDNGRGVGAPSSDPAADGLDNMRRRLEEIGGTFAIESRPGAGTRICLAVPWPLKTKTFHATANGHA